ncbi:hypothetical protein, partial [Psychrobacter sp. CAL346-MNA-CIBAN-0220]|uniref:hypothetical protein n=1 Tax=Psychrobacter sp. CAL346-MNA-CIBAN-0220 TaxID=3140457 RepID=UPI003321C08A
MCARYAEAEQQQANGDDRERIRSRLQRRYHQRSAAGQRPRRHAEHGFARTEATEQPAAAHPSNQA